jgi:isopentenyl-diphosphate delta-isomerase
LGDGGRNGVDDIGSGRRDTVVSFDHESLILVDQHDNEIGFLDKAGAHRGSGRLHRAFSLFVFDDAGRLLLQKRAAGKRLWPNHWSNTCCSHPRRGEDMATAIHRRLDEELRLRCALSFQFKFEYHAQYDDDGAEHELCWVYAGRCNDRPDFNHSEIAEVRYVAPASLDHEIAVAPDTFTPWFRLEWARLRRGLVRAG